MTCVAERTDEELAAAIATDPDALAPLLKRYWGRAYGLAYQIVRDAQDAEDAAQEAFVRLVRAGGSYQEGRSFRPWFLRVVSNSARDVAKARARRRGYEERAARPSLEASVHEGFDRETLHALAQALDALDVDQRAAITLHYLEELSFREVAEVMDCPPGTAASRVRRGLKALRGELAAMAPSAAAFTLLMKPALDVEPAQTPSPSRLRKAAAASLAAASGGGGASALVGKLLAGALAVLAVGGIALMLDTDPEAPPVGPPVATGDVPPAAGDAPSDASATDAGAPDGSAPTPSSADGERPADPGDVGAGPAQRTVTVRVRHQGGPCEGVEVRFTRLIPGDGTLFRPGTRGERTVAVTDAGGEVRQPLGRGPWELRLGPPPRLEDVPPANFVPLALVGGEPKPGLLLTFSGEAQGWYGGDDEPRLFKVATDSLSFELTIPPLGVARGKVVREGDEQPVAGATVQLGTAWTGPSNEEGAFAVPYPASEGADGASLQVGARAPGYSHASVEALPGELRDGAVTLRLRPGVELRGRVVLADGSPAANLLLELGSEQGMQLPLTTDAEGRFFAEGLTANRGDGYAAVYLKVKLPDFNVHIVDLLAGTGQEHVVRVPSFLSLRGTVLLAGRPVDGVPLKVFAARAETPEVGGGVSGHDEAQVSGAFSFAGPLDEEGRAATGRFVIGGLQSGPGWLVAASYGEFVEPEAGINAWRVDVSQAAPVLTLDLSEAVDTTLVVRQAGEAAHDVRIRAYPATAPGLELTAVPVLASGFTDGEGRCTLTGLGRGVAYLVVADLPDGRSVQGTLRGGAPGELALPGTSVGRAELRFSALAADGSPLPFAPPFQVYAVTDPSRPLRWERQRDLFTEVEPLNRVPAIGEAWVVIGDSMTRVVRRVTLDPGAVVDLGQFLLEDVPVVDLELVFDPKTIRVHDLELEWTDPATGIPARWDDYTVFAPGKGYHLRLPPGQITVRGRWRPASGEPFQALGPTIVQVPSDPEAPTPLLTVRIP
jgi:RNA polymerase sigma-70 factor (ECF subfamily)